MGGRLPKRPKAPAIDDDVDFWRGQLHNEPVYLALDDWGRLTSREIDDWYIQVLERRQAEYEKILGQTEPREVDGVTLQPGDKLIDPQTEDETLFALAAMGVQGVPPPKWVRDQQEGK